MAKKYVMFIDETGDSNLSIKDQPFTLTGVIFEYKYSVNENGKDSFLKSEINKFKLKSFGRLDLALHLVDISNGGKEFSSFSKTERKKFYNEMPRFLQCLEFSIVSITIDKGKLETYYEPSKEPYIVAFTHVLQNFCSFISMSNVESARIVIEGRDDASNLKIQKAFFDVFNNGTTHLNIEKELRDKIKGFIISKKNDPVYQSGLEIADIVCNPLSRVRRGLVEADPKCMKKGEYGVENKIFSAIKDKIFTATNSEDIRNWGFKKVPVLKRQRPWIDNTCKVLKM